VNGEKTPYVRQGAGSTRALIAFAVVLVVWGNVVSSFLGPSAWLPGGSWSFVIAGLALIAVSTVAARTLRLDADTVGFAGDPVRGAVAGLVIGVGVAIVSVFAVRVVGPAIVGRPIEYGPLASATGPNLARHIAFFLPLGDIFPEEIAFRGVLLGGLARRLTQRNAVLVAGVAFALWHAAVVLVTVADTTLGPPSAWFGPAILGALLLVFVGGSAFAWLRLRTRTLATTITLHWSFNAVLLVGLWSTSLPGPSGCC
jgi:membrane protease YdiL (CAAX protease family)